MKLESGAGIGPLQVQKAGLNISLLRLGLRVVDNIQIDRDRCPDPQDRGFRRTGLIGRDLVRKRAHFAAPSTH